MKPFAERLRATIIPLAIAVFALLQVACGDVSMDRDAPLEFRTYDTQGVDTRELTAMFMRTMRSNEIPGNVESTETGRLVVYAQPRFHEHVATLLGELAVPAAKPSELARVQMRYWSLLLRPGRDVRIEDQELEAVITSLQSRFPEYGFELHDYLEFQTVAGVGRFSEVRTAIGSSVSQRIAPAEKGFMVHGRLIFMFRDEKKGATEFDLDQIMQPGQATVIARSVSDADNAEFTYQVVVARLDVLDDTE